LLLCIVIILTTFAFSSTILSASNLTLSFILSSICLLKSDILVFRFFSNSIAFCNNLSKFFFLKSDPISKLSAV